MNKKTEDTNSRSIQTSSTESEKDVFISYRRSDGGYIAEMLHNTLEMQGIESFLDLHVIKPGQQFPKEIRKAVLSAREFILVCTPDYFYGQDGSGHQRIAMNGDWCAEELALALEKGKTIFPLVWNDSFPKKSDDIPDNLRGVLSLHAMTCPTADKLALTVQSLIQNFSEATRRNSQERVWSKKLDLDPLNTEQKPDYNVAIRNLVIDRYEETIQQFVLPLAERDDLSLNVRFSAYYAGFTFYRRMKNTEKLIKLVEKFRTSKEFSDIPFQEVALSQYYRIQYERDPDAGEDMIAQAILHAKTAMAALPQNAGVLLSYAELIADAETTHRSDSDDSIHQALETIQNAMSINPGYAKLYCIRGRLRMLVKDFDGALKDLHMAIERENSEKKDAFLRILQYQSFIHDAKLLEMEAKLTEQVEKALGAIRMRLDHESKARITKERIS